MKPRGYIFAFLAGVAGGALIGAGGVHAFRTRAETDSPQKPGSAITAAQLSATRDIPIESGDNDRLVRLFTTYQEPLALRRRAQLYEALRDLEPGDFPILIERVDRLGHLRKLELISELLER